MNQSNAQMKYLLLLIIGAGIFFIMIFTRNVEKETLSPAVVQESNEGNNTSIPIEHTKNSVSEQEEMSAIYEEQFTEQVVQETIQFSKALFSAVVEGQEIGSFQKYISKEIGEKIEKQVVPVAENLQIEVQTINVQPTKLDSKKQSRAIRLSVLVTYIITDHEEIIKEEQALYYPVFYIENGAWELSELVQL